MTQVGLFDRRQGERGKSHGMDLAAEKRKELLQTVRLAVKGIALTRESREVTADDAANWLVSVGRAPEDLGNAFGSLFRDSDWEFTGEWRESVRSSNHSRANRVWR